MWEKCINHTNVDGTWTQQNYKKKISSILLHLIDFDSKRCWFTTHRNITCSWISYFPHLRYEILSFKWMPESETHYYQAYTTKLCFNGWPNQSSQFNLNAYMSTNTLHLIYAFSISIEKEAKGKKYIIYLLTSELLNRGNSGAMWWMNKSKWKQSEKKAQKQK